MKKLLLASAIAAAATSATALEAMSDSAMSETTGQDGLTINMNLNVAADLLYIDRDGLGGDLTRGAALSMTNTITGDVTIDIDVDNDGTNQALVVGVESQNLEIGVGAISVGAVAQDAWVATSDETEILGAMDITVSNLRAEIVLGDSGYLSAGSGASSLANLDITADDLTITNISLTDSNGATGSWVNTEAGVTSTITAGGTQGSLDIATVTVTSLALDATLDVDPVAGLVLTVGSASMDVQIEDVGLNANTANASIIGDIALNNLNLGGTAISITGH